MSNENNFPITNDHEIKKEILIIKNHLIKAGLSDEKLDAAIIELKPMLDPLFKPIQSVLDIPGGIGLTQEKISIITDSHSKCIREIFSQFSEIRGYAALVIAGLVGREHS